MADRPDVDTLAETVDHALAMHPGWREAKAALSDLAARARERDEAAEAAIDMEALAKVTQRLHLLAEDDRDRLNSQLIDALDAENAANLRVTELEAALLETLQHPDHVSDEVRKERNRHALRLLAGDGGGAPHDFPPDYTGWRPIRGGDGGGA